jgi:hypothetical protein
MTLRYSYTLFAPIYDAFVAPFTARRGGAAWLLTARGTARRGVAGRDRQRAGCAAAAVRAALHRPGSDPGDAGSRSPQGRRLQPGDPALDVGDARRLPYGDAAFDVVVLHLILAVTPHPRAGFGGSGASRAARRPDSDSRQVPATGTESAAAATDQPAAGAAGHPHQRGVRGCWRRRRGWKSCPTSRRWPAAGSGRSCCARTVPRALAPSDSPEGCRPPSKPKPLIIACLARI